MGGRVVGWVLGGFAGCVGGEIGWGKVAMMFSPSMISVPGNSLLRSASFLAFFLNNSSFCLHSSCKVARHLCIWMTWLG